MIVLWVLYCVQFLFWSEHFQRLDVASTTQSKNRSPFLYYSFCLLLCSSILASSPWFMWCFFGISLGFPSQFHGISMVFLWYFKKVSMGFQWDSCRISKGHLWGFHWIPLGFLWESYRISMILLFDFYGISMRFQQGFCGILKMISMVFPWYSCGISIGFACGFYGIPWDLCDIPGRFIWDSLRFL